MRTVTFSRLAVVASAATVLVGAVGAGAALAVPEDEVVVPTITIDGVPLDGEPDTAPRGGCAFRLDFYGFGAGEQFAHVTVTAGPADGGVVAAAAAAAPTDTPLVLVDESVFVGEDDATGGFSPEGLDATRWYFVDLSRVAPHPQGGYRVELVVADGGDTVPVSKILWLPGCSEDEGGEPEPEPEVTPTPTKTKTKKPTQEPTREPSQEPSEEPTATPTPTPTTTTPDADPCPPGSDDPDCEVVETPPAFTG